MLRRPDQLLLAAQNHHFEVKFSMHLKVKEGAAARWAMGGGGGGHFLINFPDFLHLEMHANFKVVVLRRQEELVGPWQHDTIRIVCFYDFPVVFRAFQQL